MLNIIWIRINLISWFKPKRIRVCNRDLPHSLARGRYYYVTTNRPNINMQLGGMGIERAIDDQHEVHGLPAYLPSSSKTLSVYRPWLADCKHPSISRFQCSFSSVINKMNLSDICKCKVDNSNHQIPVNAQSSVFDKLRWHARSLNTFLGYINPHSFTSDLIRTTFLFPRPSIIPWAPSSRPRSRACNNLRFSRVVTAAILITIPCLALITALTLLA